VKGKGKEDKKDGKSGPGSGTEDSIGARSESRFVLRRQSGRRWSGSVGARHCLGGEAKRKGVVVSSTGRSVLRLFRA
jgi:hypothetical protein